MDPPQFTWGVISEPSPGMQHGGVIRKQDVALLPGESQAHTAIVCQIINELDNVLAVVLDGNLAGGELGLGRIPRLMPSHARRVRLRMADNQGKIGDLRIPEAVVVHAPAGSLETLDRVWSR